MSLAQDVVCQQKEHYLFKFLLKFLDMFSIKKFSQSYIRKSIWKPNHFQSSKQFSSKIYLYSLKINPNYLKSFLALYLYLFCFLTQKIMSITYYLIFDSQMSFQNENIGMMDQGYFVSRNEILKWLNDMLQLNLTKIEQLGSGAVYCQIVDVIHPGKIPMNKINWKAKSQYEFINNYRLLQDSFNKIGIKRHVDCQKLAKAKYQDNLEFSQWFKRYYDLNCGDRGNNYLAEERRGGINPNFGFAEKNVVPKTYNATGAIIPKKDSPPKKKEVVQQPPPPKKVTTATTSTRPPVKQVERKIQKKVDLKTQISPVRVPKVEKQQQVSTKRQKQLQERLKDMQDKLMMITEILRSQQGSEMKIHMIAEVVNVEVREQQKYEANLQTQTHQNQQHEQQLHEAHEQQLHEEQEQHEKQQEAVNEDEAL